jgi:hypothetical protein
MDETTVVAHEAKEASQCMKGPRCGLILHGFKLGHVHGHPCLRDEVPKVLQLVFYEEALGVR